MVPIFRGLLFGNVHCIYCPMFCLFVFVWNVHNQILLVGGWALPLWKNMSSSVGMMTFPIYGKSKPPTRNSPSTPGWVAVVAVHFSPALWSKAGTIRALGTRSFGIGLQEESQTDPGCLWILWSQDQSCSSNSKSDSHMFRGFYMDWSWISSDIPWIFHILLGVPAVNGPPQKKHRPESPGRFCGWAQWCASKRRLEMML